MPRNLNTVAAGRASMRVASTSPAVPTEKPCTSTGMPTVTPAAPPTNASSNTVPLLNCTGNPLTVRVLAPTASTRPMRSLLMRTRLACAAALRTASSNWT